ncbi:MAG TPA: glycoside hydrolase [Abditibacteriaceae bacterium]|jgi:O-glycosyl hydrolase
MDNGSSKSESRRTFLQQAAALTLLALSSSDRDAGAQNAATTTPAQAATPAQASTPVHRDSIDLDAERQVIENFGASDAWTFQTLGEWSLENRERLADLLFSKERGIGLSCWRFNIGGGINPQIRNRSRTVETFEVAEGVYDWQRQKSEQWFLGAAKKRGVEQFLAFVNSPPGRMTRNGLTFNTADATATTNLKPDFEGQFARYMVDILDHFRNNPDEQLRINFDYISPINEPQWDWQSTKQEGSRASNDDIKRVVRALDAELKRRSVPTAISAIECATLPDMSALNQDSTRKWGAPYGNYIGALIEDPTFAPLLSKRISYHSYFSDLLTGEIIDHRRQLAARMAAHPDWKLWQSEYCILEGPEGKGGGGRDLTMETALVVARVMHLDLTIANVAAWQWWLGLSSVNFKDGLIYTDYRQPGDEQTIFPAKLLWAMGNYSRFVRPGMRRIEVTGPGHDIRGLMGSAYKSEAERKVVLVYVNIGNEKQVVQPQFGLGRRPWKMQSLTRYITSDTDGDDLRASVLPVTATQLEISPRSVVTFVAQFGAATP